MQKNELLEAESLFPDWKVVELWHSSARSDLPGRAGEPANRRMEWPLQISAEIGLITRGEAKNRCSSVSKFPIFECRNGAQHRKRLG